MPWSDIVAAELAARRPIANADTLLAESAAIWQALPEQAWRGDVMSVAVIQVRDRTDPLRWFYVDDVFYVRQDGLTAPLRPQEADDYKRRRHQK